jgi:hypothetical protein
MDEAILVALTRRELAAIADLCRAVGAHDKLLEKVEAMSGAPVRLAPVTVADAYDKRNLTIIAKQESSGIALYFPEYGTRTEEAGGGTPVFVEYRHGVPHVVVWAHINQEQPTHEISLAGASKDRRQDG